MSRRSCGVFESLVAATEDGLFHDQKKRLADDVDVGWGDE